MTVTCKLSLRPEPLGLKSVSVRQDEDGQERSKDNAHHCTRNAICKVLWLVFLFS